MTLNAPSDAKHVSGLFRDSVPKIDADGEAEVVLAGRKFRIKKQFLQDAASNVYTSYIPMNVRFTSSIRVKVAGSPSGAQVSCTVSWALD